MSMEGVNSSIIGENIEIEGSHDSKRCRKSDFAYNGGVFGC
jgi:hypothetical protein